MSSSDRPNSFVMSNLSLSSAWKRCGAEGPNGSSAPFVVCRAEWSESEADSSDFVSLSDGDGMILMLRLGLRDGDRVASEERFEGISFIELSVDSPAAIEVEVGSSSTIGVRNFFDLLRGGSCISIDRRDSR